LERRTLAESGVSKMTRDLEAENARLKAALEQIKELGRPYPDGWSEWESENSTEAAIARQELCGRFSLAALSPPSASEPPGILRLRGERALAREIDIAMLSHANSPVLSLALENPEVDPSATSRFIASALLAKYRISLLFAPEKLTPLSKP
jgi:hypothetical protein